MWNSYVYYPLSDKPLIEKAIPKLNDLVFDCWHNPPTVSLGETYLEDDEDEAEIQLCLEYENEKDENECLHGHDAFALVQAFIAGIKLGAQKKED